MPYIRGTMLMRQQQFRLYLNLNWPTKKKKQTAVGGMEQTCESTRATLFRENRRIVVANIA